MLNAIMVFAGLVISVAFVVRMERRHRAWQKQLLTIAHQRVGDAFAKQKSVELVKRLREAFAPNNSNWGTAHKCASEDLFIHSESSLRQVIQDVLRRDIDV
jgi:hypothetical protein